MAVKTGLGTRGICSTRSHPSTDIINAFLQTLLGLLRLPAGLAGIPSRARLYNAGNRQAQAEVPLYETGGWSLCRAGVPEDDLSYHNW